MRRLLSLALPHNDDTVPLVAERCLHACITGDIRIKFRQPKTTVTRRSRCPAASRMAMPEAPMHEDGPLPPSVRYVR